jgi:predicted O-linked N-acetylglucosamine transferase (SPINDLY family)
MLMLVTEGPARQRVAEMMQREGVELTRLEFVGRLSRKDYHQTYQRIDVALDTFPYNGHTTSLDAFWSGVPVLTLVGKTVVGRAGLSQLSNLGLSELAARNCDEFVQIARALTADVPHLEELRGGLRDRMRASPICDASRFARNVETVYREQWRKWCIKGAGV